MKNNIVEIIKRSHEVVGQLMDGIPLSLYDSEMKVLDILTDELLAELGFDTTSITAIRDPIYGPHLKELKRALTNMYFFGKVNGQVDQDWKPIAGDNVGLLNKE